MTSTGSKAGDMGKRKASSATNVGRGAQRSTRKKSANR